ncbi:MAG: phosphoenolpyruvate synthase [Candidatus Levybacteria bacterium RIFCSPHIGHO2_02_FULL_39_36]|nr:MAG: Phosphoenolpyruvate synthase [Candidatus Levybacteria bacterium GW2011_GWA1_39_11]KKR27493.1 MAG: Phosphoenolpyruvate synthase [Microgenomates group bacterium GW2011_GWC1_39_7]OGH15384.1 MAG: phosphoenolpyruvate synthase [Candidatus Levybacteria bacterium RIFCSPHIGHO2_01_FULL_38_96]OGH25403.1 MAG: phosphoenolpyruvate synthase [Candidatus Levybacteria bacterium RIFCSPHIGHO2_12_FULL_39_39]OGH27341.1 MAG: phosphoenolpyruvate synthase [Candidatus Levybacteria bacterium RIFCSPHIGHO2_02_FULL_
MVRPHGFVVPLYDVDKDDTAYVGGKGANLGEMIEAGFPVPGGFVVTSSAYFEFLKQNNLDQKILHLLATINFDKDESLNQVSKHIKNLILTGKIPDEIVTEVFDEYEKIGEGLVAVRSSATAEDSKDASFAGQNETFLDVKGEAVLAQKLREGWASMFSPRSIFYRHEKKISQLRAGIALVVQKMIQSDASGVIFTVDPVTGDKNKIIIEAIWGLGEYIVQGKLTPDHYEVDKKAFKILTSNINPQTVMLVKSDKGVREINVPLLKRQKVKLSNQEIIDLAKLAAKIEKHYYFPQDLEWAKEKNKIYIVQTRPITTINQKSTPIKSGSNIKNQKEIRSSNTLGKAILIGSPASPGIGTGHVKKLKSASELSKVNQGDVLVAENTNPDFVPAMKKASAIITEQGGRTSHAAIVAREFGIPAVVGTPRALSMLRDEEIVTVNGTTGEIFKGGFLITQVHKADRFSSIKTATKLLVNIADPEAAERVAGKNVDGVGLLRAEFMIAGIGTHPKKLIHDGKSNFFVDKLSEGIEKICRAFYPRPVLYRATDFKTNEYMNLSGGKQYEPQESNPMLGYRGAFRYIHDPDVFKLELCAIKKVQEKKGLNNLNLMIPFVRTIKELQEVKKIISHENLKRSHTFKLYMMTEIPSNIILIEDFIKTGIDGVSIGSNDLTMLILGIDRDNREVASEFDERNEAVMWAIERVIRACRKNNVSVSICGQAPSVYPGLIEKLVSYGIDSISVSPDAIDDTRRHIYLAEGKIVKK